MTAIYAIIFGKNTDPFCRANLDLCRGQSGLYPGTSSL